MTSLAATVLIPTHDHSELLLYAARSALRQTVADLEVLIVGDGVPDATRETVADLVEEDERVRFFDKPKGKRNGEAYRGPILAEARGSVVCYLSDDDLWLPDHVETMVALLENADFASATTLRYHAEEELEVLFHDDAVPVCRELLFSGVNRIPLSAGAHTFELYRRLPHGWRTTPAGVPTDLYMWQQILAGDSCRAVCSTMPTVLNFPSSMRVGWSAARRVSELAAWSERIASPDWAARSASELLAPIMRAQAAEWAHLKAERLRQHRELIDRGRRAEELRGEIAGLKRDRRRAREQLRREREERRAVETDLRRVRSGLARARPPYAHRVRARARRLASRLSPRLRLAARRAR